MHLKPVLYIENKLEVIEISPLNQTSFPNSSLMLYHRLRHRPSIKPTLGRRLVFVGQLFFVISVTFLVNAASTRPCYECEDLSGNEDGSCYNLVQGDKDMKNVTCPDVCFTKTKKYGGNPANTRH